jgi:hypothetical protein
MEYANGTEASAETGVYNHHSIYMNNIGKSQMLVCKSGTAFKMPAGPKLLGGAAIDGSASVYTTPDGSFKSGNYIQKDATITMMSELVNYRTEPQEVYVTTEVEAMIGPRSDYFDAVTLPLSAVPCVEAQFILSKPVEVHASPDYIVPEDSTIINMGKMTVQSHD